MASNSRIYALTIIANPALRFGFMTGASMIRSNIFLAFHTSISARLYRDDDQVGPDDRRAGDMPVIQVRELKRWARYPVTRQSRVLPVWNPFMWRRGCKTRVGSAPVPKQHLAPSGCSSTGMILGLFLPVNPAGSVHGPSITSSGARRRSSRVRRW